VKTYLQILGLVVVCSGALQADALSQETPVEPTPDRARDSRPHPLSDLSSLAVRVVISRHHGEKKVSSVPFTLSVNTDGNASMMRLSTSVPVKGSQAAPAGESSPVTTIVPFRYEEVGTSIDCRAFSLHDGRFRLLVSIEDSSVYAPAASESGTTPTAKEPSFRSFKSTQNVVLKDGQSIQYTTATDRITGEVIKVDVSLAVAGK